MAENKTKPTGESVEKFLNTIVDPVKRKDCFEIAEMMKRVSRCEPQMWGPAIVGFGSYHYKYESGHEGDSCLAGFAPRKGNIAIYTNLRLDQDSALLKKLGKFKNGKSCINIKKLDDIDKGVLSQLIEMGVKNMMKKYPS